MNLQTATEGLSRGIIEPVLGMQHLVFCLMAGLMLFVFRKRPRDLFYYALTLPLGFAIEWHQPLPLLLVNLVIPVSLTVVLFQQWFYEKMAVYTLPLLLIAGVFHGASLGRLAAGSSLVGFVSYAIVASLVQGLTIYGFGRLCRHLATESPDGFEGLENILSATGTGVAMAYFFLAF